MYSYYLCVIVFARKGLIYAIINIQKYNFEIFISMYLENDQSCLHMFLHRLITNQSNSLYLLYTGQLAAFPAILDSFLLAQPIPLALLQGGSGQEASKWHVKAKNSQISSIGTIFTSTCHAMQLNTWPNSSTSRVGIHSGVSACHGKMETFKGHLSTRGRQTSMRKGLSESRLFNLQQYY